MRENLSSPIRDISPDEIGHYRAEGVVCLRGMFQPYWIDLLRGAVERAMSSPGPHAEDYVSGTDAGRFFSDLDLWQRFDSFREYALQSPAARVAA